MRLWAWNIARSTCCLTAHQLQRYRPFAARGKSYFLFGFSQNATHSSSNKRWSSSSRSVQIVYSRAAVAYLGFSFGGDGYFPSANFLSPPLRVGARGETPGKDALLNTISAFSCIRYSACLGKRCWKRFIRSNHCFEHFQMSAFFFISSPSPQRHKRIEIAYRVVWQIC